MLRTKVIGLGRIAKKFDSLPEALRNELIEISRETAIVDIETVAKQKLTSDGHIDTGRLRASIHTEYKGSPLSVLGTVKGPIDFIVGTNVVYAWMIEKIDSYVLYAFKKAKTLYIKAVKEAIGRVLDE